MKQLVEFKTAVYPAKEYQDYIKKMYPDSENGEEIEQWQRDIYRDEATFPDMRFASIFIDPQEVVTVIEVSSLKEMHDNPDEPGFDSLELFMNEGVNVQIICTKKEFIKKLKEKGVEF